jgi:hypothetical protein
MSSEVERAEAEVRGMMEDYGQWMWDAGYMDNPTGENLVDEAKFKRDEFEKALNSLLVLAYADGRKDEAEESGVASKLIDAWVTTHGKPVPWEKAVEIMAIVQKLPESERARLLSLAEEE